jgi:hypothetical protein
VCRCRIVWQPFMAESLSAHTARLIDP